MVDLTIEGRCVDKPTGEISADSSLGVTESTVTSASAKAISSARKQAVKHSPSTPTSPPMNYRRMALGVGVLMVSLTSIANELRLTESWLQQQELTTTSVNRDQPDVSSSSPTTFHPLLFANETEAEAFRQKKLNRPPLEELISDYEEGIVGDVSFLLDFAILGHAKTATSFLNKWLHGHSQTAIWDFEVCDMYHGRPAGLVRRLYREFPPGDLKRGFKCPGNFSGRYLKYFRQYFNKTLLVIGLRHPIWWFQSYYNFRNRHLRNDRPLPEPEQLIGTCTRQAQGVCTDRANFHVNLAQLGKTNVTSPAEQQLLRMKDDNIRQPKPIDNPVFLYDVAQLDDTDPVRSRQLRQDFKDFLGLTQDLAEVEPVIPSASTKYNRINICDPEFDALRLELTKIGKRASMWIRKYFLRSNQVFVSNPDHFAEVLRQWHQDPCINMTNLDLFPLLRQS